MRVKINLDHITNEEIDMISEIIKHQETTDRDEPGMYRCDNLEVYITRSGNIEIKRWECGK